MLHPLNPLARLVLVTLAAFTTAAGAETVNVTVESSQPWVGYVNLFERPAGPGTDRGAYWTGFFLQAYELAALPAGIVANVATLAPNGIFGGPPMGSMPDWWTPDGNGGFVPNKVIEANAYVDTGFSGVALSGNTVRFTGTTTANSLVAPYAGYAFIRDFEPGYTVLHGEAITTPLAAGQSFELNLDTVAGHGVQYGFALVGPNADPAALPGLGSISISAVPEPATPAMLLLGVLTMAAWVRRRG